MVVLVGVDGRRSEGEVVVLVVAVVGGAALDVVVVFCNEWSSEIETCLYEP